MSSDFDTSCEPSKEHTGKVFSRLIACIKPYKGFAIISAGCLVFKLLGELFTPIVQLKIIDEIVSAVSNAGTEKSYALQNILLYCGIMLFIVCVIFACSFVQTLFTQFMCHDIMRDMRNSLFVHTVYQSSAYLSEQPNGQLVVRVTSDVDTINNFFSNMLADFLRDFMQIIGVAITMFVLSPKLALAVTAFLPLQIAAAALYKNKTLDAYRRQRSSLSGVSSFMSEQLSGREVVQTAAAEKRASAGFAQCNKLLLKSQDDELTINTGFGCFGSFLNYAATAVIIVLGAWLAKSGGASIGTIIVFMNFIGLFMHPVNDIAAKFANLQGAIASGERIFSFIDINNAIYDKNGPQGGDASLISAQGKGFVNSLKSGIKHNLMLYTPSIASKLNLSVEPGRADVSADASPDSEKTDKSYDIEFRDVRFSYRKGEEVLRGLSFKINQGQKAAIVGYTGAGKSTISNVLRRFWDIDSGQILLGGVDIKELPLDKLRRTILPVLQDVFLFSVSIADNIALGLPLSREEIERAAKTVSAHDFISALPEGYDTVLAEGASNISSGQRQLISFARVIAHNPPIIVFDEATSSIDSETEMLVQRGIESLLAGRTSLVIAHRLSTIRNSSTILTMENGRLVEQGSHDELVRKGGLYAGLLEMNEL